MKHLFSSATTLLAAVLCTLLLGSCSRANYAVLPKSAPYLGSVSNQRATPAPAAATAVAPIATPTEEVASVAHVTPVPAAPAAAQPSAAATTARAAAVITNAPVQSPEAVAAPSKNALARKKITRFQKLLISKTMHAVDKQVSKALTVDKKATASPQRIGGYLRTGIILLVIALIVSLFSRLIGTIIALLGLLFIVLWLLDEL